jgi:hypothetical protein
LRVALNEWPRGRLHVTGPISTATWCDAAPLAMGNPLHQHGRFFDLWSAFYRRTFSGLELRRVQRLAIDTGPR